MTTRAAALIVAAGRGTRLNDTRGTEPKQYKMIGGSTILASTIRAIGSHQRINRIIVVIGKDDQNFYNSVISELHEDIRSKILPPAFGGDTRQLSVFSGLSALELKDHDFVFIHDAARPFLSHCILDRQFTLLDQGHSGVLAATKINDTIKKANESGFTIDTLDRSRLWAAQTPQAFVFEKILKAHQEAALLNKFDFTDDTSLAEWNGIEVALSEGNISNYKITTATDLKRAEIDAKHIMTSKHQSENTPLETLTDIRTGIGYDVHAFEPGNDVIIGGVRIAHTAKLKGHSDADVVLHAITDATLGAIGDGDIGQHFPPSDPRWNGASSDQFQIDAIQRIEALGGRLAHIDVTIICEEPKIGPHRDAIRESIARICNISKSRVSVKATTSEKLGFTGRKEGIAALSNVTVRLPMREDD